MSTPPPLPPSKVVWLVASREFTSRVRAKAFLVSNAVVLLLLLGGFVAGGVSGGQDDADRVGLVGGAEVLTAPLAETGAVLGVPVEAVAIQDESAAREQVAAGELIAALIPHPSSPGAFTAVTESALPGGVEAVLAAAVQEQAVTAALQENGVPPGELAAATAGAVLDVEAIEPPDPERAQRAALAYITVFVLFFQILTFGMFVAMGVVEEKSSRVVELLLSTIRPIHLLTGKIAGIGAVGLLLLLAYGVVMTVAGLATGLVTLTGTAAAVLATTIAWFVLGYAFFAVLFAAAGSLVSRQEDVSSTSAPIQVLMLGMFLLAQFSLDHPDGRVVSVMSWIPPFSAMLMPLRVAAGSATPAQVVGTTVIMLVATAALAVLTSRIYERSVLRIGTTVPWRQALRTAR